MREVRHSVDIRVATPARIWEMITALRYLHLWFADVEEVTSVNSLDIQIGTTFSVTCARAKDHTWTIAEWQPLQCLCFGEQDRATRWIFDLEPTEQGTRVALAHQWARRGFAARVFPSTSQHRLVSESLIRLKELIDFNRDIALLHGIGDE